MATSPELEIVWDGGSLDLMGENDTPYGPVVVQALADGTEWGNPESVRRALFSALADGSASALERHDNRTVTVKLRLTAADSAALAGGEAPLHMLSGVKRAELRWTPPNDFAAPAVYIVVASDLTQQMDDLAENRCRRFYALTLVCLPFARSLDSVTIEALPPFVAAPSVLDDGTTTTGWSGLGDASFAVIGGGVQISGSTGATTITLSKTLARAKRYFALEVENVWGRLTSFTSGDGTRPLLRPWGVGGPMSAPQLVGREGNWYFFDLPASLGDVVGFDICVDLPGAAAVRVLTVAESDTPALSTGRQSLRVIPTPGSARAAGSLLVEARDAEDDGTGTALGEVIVYTGPQYDPRLSPWRTSTWGVSDTLSGLSHDSVDGTFNFVRPASSFVDGSHVLWVQASPLPFDTVTTWTVTVRAIGTPGAYSGPSDALAVVATLTATTTANAVNDHELFNLGVIDLPGFDVGVASQVNLHFEIAASTDLLYLGEALLFNRSRGSLTIVDARTMKTLTETSPGVWDATTGATRVWLDPASLEGSERVVAGRLSRASSLPVSLASNLRSYDGAHPFTPDATYLYVGTTGVVDPKVTGEFRPAWHTHPAS